MKFKLLKNGLAFDIPLDLAVESPSNTAWRLVFQNHSEARWLKALKEGLRDGTSLSCVWRGLRAVL
jgi:hypothetical protein